MNPLVRSGKVHSEQEGEGFSAPLCFAEASHYNGAPPSTVAIAPNRFKISRVFNSIAALLTSRGARPVGDPSSSSDLCTTSGLTLLFVHDVMEAEYVAFRMKHRFIAFLMPIMFLFLTNTVGGGFYFAERLWFVDTHPDALHIYTSQRLLYGNAFNSLVVIVVLAMMVVLVRQNPMPPATTSSQRSSSDGEPSYLVAAESSASSNEKASLPYVHLALGETETHVSRRKNAKYFELCLCLFYALCVPAFLVMLFFSKIDCFPKDTCTSQFAYETVAAPLSLVCCILLPMRVHLFLFGTAILSLCRIVMHFLPDVPPMDVQNVLMTHFFVFLSLAGSLVLSTSLDRWARDQFATYIRSIIELDELREVQQRKKQMVSHHIPQRFVSRVESAVGGGIVMDASPLGVSCVIRLLRFAEWASLRSASEVLQLVQTAFGAIDKVCRPFRSAVSGTLVRHHSLGDEVVLTSTIATTTDGSIAALVGLVLSVLSKYVIDVRRVKPVPVEPFLLHRATALREAPQMGAVLGSGPISAALVHAGNVNLVAEGPAVRSCRNVLRVLQAVATSTADEAGVLYVGDSLFRELLEMLDESTDDLSAFFVAAKRVVFQVKATLEPGGESPDTTSPHSDNRTRAEDLFLHGVLRCRSSRTEVVGELLVGVRSLTAALGPVAPADSYSLSSLRSMCPSSLSPHVSRDELADLPSSSPEGASVADTSVLDAVVIRLLPSSTSTVMVKRLLWFLPLFLSFTDPKAELSYRNEFSRSDPFRQWAFVLICLLNSIAFFAICFSYPVLPHTFDAMSSFMWLMFSVLCCALMLPTVYFGSRLPTAFFAVLDVLYFAMCACLLTAIVAAEGTDTPIGAFACTPYLFLFTYLPLLRPQQSNVGRLLVVDVPPLVAFSYVSYIRQYCDWPVLTAIGSAISTIVVVRLFWDGHLRDYYAAQLELLEVKASLTRDYEELEETLQLFAPTGVAKQLIQNSRKAKARAEIDISGIDFNKSTDLTTGVGDVPFVIFEVQPRDDSNIEQFHEAATAARRHFLATTASHEKLEVVKATATCIVMCSPKEPATCQYDNDEERTLTLTVAFASILTAITQDPLIQSSVMYHRAVMSCGQLKGAVIGRDVGASFDFYGGPMATALQLLESLEPNSVVATPKFVSFLWPFGALSCHCATGRCSEGTETSIKESRVRASSNDNDVVVPLCFEGPLRLSIRGLGHLTHCFTVHIRQPN